MPFWFRKFVFEANQQDCVSARLNGKIARLVSNAGASDLYSWGYASRIVTRITRQEAVIGRAIRPRRIYDAEFLQPDRFAHHLLIRNRRLKAGSLLDCRLAAHRFLNLLMPLGYSGIYPEVTLQADWEGLKGAPIDSYLGPGSVCPYGYNGWPGWYNGRRLVRHFFDASLRQSALAQCYQLPKRLFWALRRLADRRVTVSTEKVNSLLQRRYGPRPFSPVPYIALLKQLGVKGSVADLYPGSGYKALACAVLGLTYCAGPDAAWDAARDGLSAFCGLRSQSFDSQADVVLADDNFLPINLEATLATLGPHRHLVACVAERQEAERYKPKALLHLDSRSVKAKPGWLAIW